MIQLTYAPDVVEETVLLAEGSMPAADRAAFRRERDRLYELRDPDERDDRFGGLHRRWFVRLGAHLIVEQAVAERPTIAGRLAAGRVIRAVTRAEEGADLVDRISASGGQPLLVVRLRPSVLLDGRTLLSLLRHDLTHVEDMLDPAFGYERSLAPSDDGPSSDNIVRDRYRVLWDVTIDGRLSRAGLADGPVRAQRWHEFHAAFPMLGDRRLEVFDDWFDRPTPTHRDLASFARAPRAFDGPPAMETGRCPLCRFPVATLDRHPERLTADARAAILRDHPSWSLERGLCSQCLDLYEVRHEERV